MYLLCAMCFIVFSYEKLEEARGQSKILAVQKRPIFSFLFSKRPVGTRGGRGGGFPINNTESFAEHLGSYGRTHDIIHNPLEQGCK